MKAKRSCAHTAAHSFLSLSACRCRRSQRRSETFQGQSKTPSICGDFVLAGEQLLTRVSCLYFVLCIHRSWSLTRDAFTRHDRNKKNAQELENRIHTQHTHVNVYSQRRGWYSKHARLQSISVSYIRNINTFACLFGDPMACLLFCLIPDLSNVLCLRILVFARRFFFPQGK